jgi:hypothetical protein
MTGLSGNAHKALLPIRFAEHGSVGIGNQRNRDGRSKRFWLTIDVQGFRLPNRPA